MAVEETRHGEESAFLRIFCVLTFLMFVSITLCKFNPGIMFFSENVEGKKIISATL